MLYAQVGGLLTHNKHTNNNNPARALGPGHTVVTVLCDGGERYMSKTYQDGYLASRGLRSPGADVRVCLCVCMYVCMMGGW